MHAGFKKTVECATSRSGPFFEPIRNVLIAFALQLVVVKPGEDLCVEGSLDYPQLFVLTRSNLV